jgi:hypothetical protein
MMMRALDGHLAGCEGMLARRVLPRRRRPLGRARDLGDPGPPRGLGVQSFEEEDVEYTFSANRDTTAGELLFEGDKV